MDYLVFDIKGGRMIDFHSHVLPGIDDGSDCVEESLEMLHTAKNQGVSTMLATPHFYAQDVSVDHFLEKRKKAYDTLKRCMDDSDCPDIRLGAEVCYFRGIGRAREIEKLCIEGTRVIMVELPFRQWDEEVLRDAPCGQFPQDRSGVLALHGVRHGGHGGQLLRTNIFDRKRLALFLIDESGQFNKCRRNNEDVLLWFCIWCFEH